MMTNTNRPQKALAKEEFDFNKINQEINERLDVIGKEFKSGFDLIKKHSHSVTVFGSARALPSEIDYLATMELTRRIATELDYSIVTGGSTGIMEAANRGAFENGGKSLGLNIQLPSEQNINKYLTDKMEFRYFFSRKVCLSFAAEAYVFLPGGFGTFDELFEILTLVQTKKIREVPVILFGTDFWNKFDEFVRDNLLKAEKIDEADTKLYTISDDIDEIINIIKRAPIRITA